MINRKYLRRLTRKNWKTVDQKVQEILEACEERASNGFSTYMPSLGDMNPLDHKNVWLKLVSDYDLSREGIMMVSWY